MSKTWFLVGSCDAKLLAEPSVVDVIFRELTEGQRKGMNWKHEARQTIIAVKHSEKTRKTRRRSGRRGQGTKIEGQRKQQGKMLEWNE